VKGIDWFVARRYLSSTRKGRFGSFSTLISIGGVAVGVMALLIVVAVMTGLQRDLKEKILGSTPHVYVFEPIGEFKLGDWERALDVVRKTPGVIAAEPFMLSDAVGIVSPNRPTYGQPAVLQGIDPWSSRLPLTELENKIRDGVYPWGRTKSGLPGLLIGYLLANRMQLFPGDTVIAMTIANMQVNSLLGTLQPTMQQFEVTGTFDTGMYEYDNMNMYGDLREVQAYLGLPADTVSGIAVNVRDEMRADDFGAAIRQRLDNRVTTRTWLDLNQSLFDALKLEKLAMEMILSLIILVASFNIVSTLMMLVTEKTREIGILKSMGMTDGSVLRIFVVQGLIIGVVGTAIGLVGGLSIMWVIKHFELIKLPADVYFIDKLPLSLDFFDGAMIVVVSILISLLATIYPAMKASKLVPVDAIRHD
jgi:lipoprotein-releasing system permease protein